MSEPEVSQTPPGPAPGAGASPSPPAAPRPAPQPKPKIGDTRPAPAVPPAPPEQRGSAPVAPVVALERTGGTATKESAGEEGRPELRLPAEALVRLVYGRLDPDHTPVAADSPSLDEVRGLFPGF